MHKLLRPPDNYDLDVKQRVKLYKLLLYAQIISTILVVIGFIFFILIVARVVHI